jgi:hypothetical protein
MTNNTREWNWLDLYFIGAYILYLSNALFVRGAARASSVCVYCGGAEKGAPPEYGKKWLASFGKNKKTY